MVTTAISPASLSTALLFFNFLTWVLPSLAAIIPPQQRPQPKYTFTEHCADDHDKVRKKLFFQFLKFHIV